MPEWIGLWYREPVVLKGDLYQGNDKTHWAMDSLS